MSKIAEQIIKRCQDLPSSDVASGEDLKRAHQEIILDVALKEVKDTLILAEQQECMGSKAIRKVFINLRTKWRLAVKVVKAQGRCAISERHLWIAFASQSWTTLNRYDDIFQHDLLLKEIAGFHPSMSAAATKRHMIALLNREFLINDTERVTANGTHSYALG